MEIVLRIVLQYDFEQKIGEEMKLLVFAIKDFHRIQSANRILLVVLVRLLRISDIYNRISPCSQLRSK